MKCNTPLTTLFSRMGLALALSLSLTQCAEDEVLDEARDNKALKEAEAKQEETVRTTAVVITPCSSCDYIVPANKTVIDGNQINLPPGSVIGLQANVSYKNIIFRNLTGTRENPIVIKNCDGTAILTGTGLPYTMKVSNSKFLKVTGGTTNKQYGIKINGGHISMSMEYLTTNFEIDHVEIYNSGFAGIMAKTDPSCDILTTRGYFTMRDVSIHDNYVHDVGGEGFYVGNSKFAEGQNTPCGVRFPHDIENVAIFNNRTNNTGWEGVQLGCGGKDAFVYSNTVENYGLVNKAGQNNGIQIGSGTGGVCYNNFIKGGKGNGLIVLGTGENIVYNNIIVDAGSHGVFCDERASTGPGFQFINNTIINPLGDGIRIYAELLPNNVIKNNIIVNPGSYTNYGTAGDQKAYINKLSNAVRIDLANNYFTRDIASLRFENPKISNFRLKAASPAIDGGTDISSYGIATDFYQDVRLSGRAYDIGASEY